MTGDDPRRFTIVHSLEGSPSDDGEALLVEATGFDGSVVRFAIPVDNIQHFVAFLLVWAGTMNAGAPGGDAVSQTPQNTLPIPATAVSVGEPEGDEGYLGISVGRAELIFSVPLSAFGLLGRSLMTAGTPVNDVPS
jgi:hypothetical protein